MHWVHTLQGAFVSSSEGRAEGAALDASVWLEEGRGAGASLMRPRGGQQEEQQVSEQGGALWQKGGHCRILTILMLVAKLKEIIRLQKCYC